MLRPGLVLVVLALGLGLLAAPPVVGQELPSGASPQDPCRVGPDVKPEIGRRSWPQVDCRPGATPTDKAPAPAQEDAPATPSQQPQAKPIAPPIGEFGPGMGPFGPKVGEFGPGAGKFGPHVGEFGPGMKQR